MAGWLVARWFLGGEMVGGEIPWWRDDRIPRVAGYVELSSVPFKQTSQIFKMIFLYCKAFPASEKTKTK